MKKKKYNKFILHETYAVMIVKRQNLLLEVLIDLEDVEKVKNVGSWHAIKDTTLQTTSYYIAHRYGNKKIGQGVIKLHRFVNNCPQNLVVDHINHNTLDNRKQNLRNCTIFENQQNLRSKQIEQTGVYYRARGVWVGNITKDKKRIYKEFKTKEEAIKWRKEQEYILYGIGGLKWVI